MKQQFDYIIAGAGAAGLSLIMRMMANPFFENKKILLIDKAPKNVDDRTWCFWENKPGFFEPVVQHAWPKLWVKHPDGQLNLTLKGYQYKMIRGLAFYQYCFNAIGKDNRVTVLYGEIHDMDATTGRVTVDNNVYEAPYIFSSLGMPLPPVGKNEFFLWQHFRGWWIETQEDHFDPTEADLMNFRVSQDYGCTFVYVMPVTRRKALIEYTLFSETPLAAEVYDEGLKDFCSKELTLKDYAISETEQGKIPMTNQAFPNHQGKVIYLGTSGGQTKASTGYTFQNIQKHSDQIIEALTLGKSLVSLPKVSMRFPYYDGVLLRVLQERKVSGADVFFRLFQKNPGYRILRFLDNETHFWEEVAIMNSTPKEIFVKAAVRQWG